MSDFIGYVADPDDEVKPQALGKRPLTLEQLRFVNWAEQYWNLHKKFPPVGTYKAKYPSIDLSDDLVQLALSNRGIILPMGEEVPSELTSEQVAAVSLILDYGDKRSHNVKLRSLGITPTKWHGWLKNEIFKNYLHSLSANGLEDALHVAHTGLLNATERGDVSAIKYYMELTGRFTEEAGQNQNFKVMVHRLGEAIQRHVKDPEVINMIAADFEIIMQGKVPNSVPVLNRGDI